MQAVIWQEDLIGVAKFLNACLHKMRVKHMISLV